MGVLPLETAEDLDVDGCDEVDLDRYLLKCLTKGKTCKMKQPPRFIPNIHKARGLVAYLNVHRSYFK